MADERLSAEELDAIQWYVDYAHEDRNVINARTIGELCAELRASWAELEATQNALREWTATCENLGCDATPIALTRRLADICSDEFRRFLGGALVGSVPQPLAEAK